MQNFHDFLTEVQTVEVRVVERYMTENGQIIEYTPEEVPNAPYRRVKFLDASHYSQHRSNYEAELKRLQQRALSEFLNLSPEQIKRHLQRLLHLKRRFTKFWHRYKQQLKALQEGTLTNTNLELEILNLFIVDKHDEGSILHRFMFDLHDAIMFKQGYLEEFESQAKELIDHSTQIKGTSLIWWKRSRQICEHLMNELHRKDYIDSNSLANFMDANQKPFSANKSQNRIWWKKSNRLLKYLMDELARLDYVDRYSPVNKHIKEHFIDRYKKPFTDSIKQNSSGTGLNKSGKPKGYETIDNLLKSL